MMFNKEKKIYNKINSNINKEDLVICLDELNEQIKEIYANISNDYSEFKKELNNITFSTSLHFQLNDNKIEFYAQNKDNFLITINDGKVFYPKKNGFNIIYFEIIEKYKTELDSIAKLFKRIKPELNQIKMLEIKKDILEGKKIYKAYIEEQKYDEDLKKELKQYNNKIEPIKEKIYSKTGWYYINDDKFGCLDTDNNIINAIYFSDKWYPFSTEEKNKYVEESFIMDNLKVLTDYKILRNELNEKLNIKKDLQNHIQIEINNRDELIEEIKKEIISKNGIKQKVI